MTNNNKNTNQLNEIEIDGKVYSYRCDICWQELDDTDIQFKPCNRCHLQVCLFCFNKHTNSKESYAKTCPKCREPIDMEQIMKQNIVDSKNKNSVGKKLLNQKKLKQHSNSPGQNNSNSQRKRRRKKGNKDRNKDKNKEHKESHHNTKDTNHNDVDNGHGDIDIDEEIPKSEWKNYLKGRFISRDSIIVAPVIAKFNHEEAISDNFKAYGRITRINMWDDESAHIMYDKQYFADALVDKIQDVAVRYQGQFGLMSAKYHFRRPCEEFMDPERRCPMQCRKFHGPYYKIDFIPLDQYLDEEARETWIEERKQMTGNIVKARYRKFRKKYMDNMPLPMDHGHNKKSVNLKEQRNINHNNNNDEDEYYNDDNYDEYAYDEDNYYEDHGARNSRYIRKTHGYRGHHPRYYRRGDRVHDNNLNGNNHVNGNKTAITLSYNNMGKANKLLALDDSLQKHMRNKPNQPLPPSRPPPQPPIHAIHPHGHPLSIHHEALNNEETKSIKSLSDNVSTSGSIGSGKRTRPPIHHTTSAQMRSFMVSNPGLTIHPNDAPIINNGHPEQVLKSNKVKKLMGLKRTKSDDQSLGRHPIKAPLNALRSTKSDPDTEYSRINGKRPPFHSHATHPERPPIGYFNGDHTMNGGDHQYSVSNMNLHGNHIPLSHAMQQSPHSRSSGALKEKLNKKGPSKTVDLLKSLKKKKRKQRDGKQQGHPSGLPAVHPLQNAMSTNLPPKEPVSTFKPHDNLMMQPHPTHINLNPANFTVNNLSANPGYHPFANPGHAHGHNNNSLVPPNANGLGPNVVATNPTTTNAKYNINAPAFEPNPYSLNDGNIAPFQANQMHNIHGLEMDKNKMKMNPNSKEFIPSIPSAKSSTFGSISPVNPKKSKLNANATEFVIDPNKSGTSSPYKSRSIAVTTTNIKSFDIRNLGPLIPDKDILSRGDDKHYDYDFVAALDESHLDLNDEQVNVNEASLRIPTVEKVPDDINGDEQQQQTILDKVEIENVERGKNNDVDDEDVDKPEVVIRKQSDDKSQALEIKDNDEQISDDKGDEKQDDDKQTLVNKQCGITSVIYYTASSDESSEDEYNRQEWTFETLWDKLTEIIKQQQSSHNDKAWCNWKNIRKLLKNGMHIMDWTYVKENKLVNKVKARFRMEFENKNGDKKEIDQMYKALMTAGSTTDSQSVLPRLLEKQSLRTTEANSFANLKYEHCSVIDLDLRISDIRNYMTDLLTSHNTTSTAIPSQYDTTIIAELGQILSIYQKWIDEKKQKLNNTQNSNNVDKQKQPEPVDRNISHSTQSTLDIVDVANQNNEEIDEQHRLVIDEQDGIKQLFGISDHHDINNNDQNEISVYIPNDGNNGSDFYSRLLDEVQQKALHDHADHDYPENWNDSKLTDPKNLVMDYIGFGVDGLDDNHKDKDNNNDLNINDGNSADLLIPTDVSQNILVSNSKQTEVVNNDDGKNREIVYNGDIPDEELYDYEYSDESDDDIAINTGPKPQNKDLNNTQCVIQTNLVLEADDDDAKKQELKSLEKQEVEADDDHLNDLLADSVVLGEDKKNNHLKLNNDDDCKQNDDYNDDDLYQYEYDDEESEEHGHVIMPPQRAINSANDINGGLSAIFSRVHSPPPRHRGDHHKDDEMEEVINNGEEIENENNFDVDYKDECVGNGNDRSYYNSQNQKYPSRRGRYSKNYRPKNQGQRYSPNQHKMEWKKKEKEVTDITDAMKTEEK